MSDEIMGIDDVAPVGENDGLDLTSRDDLAGKPMVIDGAQFFPTGTYGEWWRITATLEDTGERVAFAGATVLNKQIKQVKESGVLPPIGNGVRAVIVKELGKDGGNDYWTFRTPPKPGERIERAAGAPGVSDRTKEVQGLAQAGNVAIGDVQNFVKALESGTSGKVADLNDGDYGTLVSWLNEKADAEVPF